MTIECSYITDCISKSNSKCKVCVHNSKRNYVEDHFKPANDNPIPDKCPKLRYDGPAEQTAGYKCPVCGRYTNPYAMRDNLCGSCGYQLNV